MDNAQKRHNGTHGRVYHRSAKPRKGVARTFGESADWSDYNGCEGLYTNRVIDLVKCMRPLQWVKNLLLLAVPFFAFFDRSQAEGSFAQRVTADPVAFQETMGVALIAFILLSSASYIINDAVDLKRDRDNPQKQQRPIVARKVSLGAALPLAGITLIGGLTLAAWLGMTRDCMAFLYVCITYSVLQFAYTFLGRRIPDVGAILLAIGFLLRAVAGACVIHVAVSPWLLLCVFFGAHFVALCKRRSAFFLKGQAVPTSNEPRILDFQINIEAAVTVTCYALYTLAERTIACFETEHLIYTLPFVVFGVFRYVRLTYQTQKAGTPEMLFLRDPLLIITGILWIVTCGIVLSHAV